MLSSIADAARSRRLGSSPIRFIHPNGFWSSWSTLPPPRLLPNRPSAPWYRQLNSYHWLVLVVATLAWAFDCLSQQIFNLARKPAMARAVQLRPSRPISAAPWRARLALLVGWATGGIIFGILGDRIGRAKTLTIMIVCYSVSTGLCGLSRGPWDYFFLALSRAWAAGGIFPISCTLVAESLPDRGGRRPWEWCRLFQRWATWGPVSSP